MASDQRNLSALPLSWVERVVAAFGGYKREKPRDPEEARLLRERGTPEHLIGPENIAANRGGDRMDTWADVG